MAAVTAVATRKTGLLRRLLERPQQVFLRRALFQLHLWAGLLLALYVIAIGVSGSILVFKEELMPKPHVSVGPVNYRACTADQLTHAMERADAQIPGMKAFLASCPTPANKLFTVTVREVPKGPRGLSGRSGGTEAAARSLLKQRAIYIHPQTGAVVGLADRESSWVETVEQFHVSLLLGRTGRLWNGAGAAVLAALALSGFVLWWPGLRIWTRGLTIDFRKSWKRINFDLHTVLGFWTLFFTLTWAMTGMYFAWPKIFTTPLQKVSPITTAMYPAAQLKVAQQQPSAPDRPLDVSAMIADAQRESLTGHLEGVFYGSGPRPVLTVYMARGVPGDYSNTDFVYFDQRSGHLLYTWHRGQNHTLGDWLLWLVAPLHFGTSWGQTVKALWALLGLTLPVLTITGMLMYWNRWLRKRWAKV